MVSLRLLMTIVLWLPTACTAHEPAPSPEDSVSPGPRVIAASWFAGECAFDCQRVVTFDGGTVILTVRDRFGPPPRTATGTLTPDGASVLRATARILETLDPPRFYGCPDCVDQGGGDIRWIADGRDRQVTFDPAELPPSLSRAYARIRGLIDDLGHCRVSALAEPTSSCRPALAS